MNPREIESWINGFETDLNTEFSQSTREVLRIALKEFSGEEYEFEGLITPSLFLACLHTGRTEPPSDELLATLFRIVRSEIFELLGTRYNTISDPGPEIIELADTQFPEASHFVSQTFQNAARAIPSSRTQFLPVDFLVSLTELLPEGNDTLSSCPVLCGPGESFRSLLYPWLSQLSNNPSFPKDLSERLKNIRFSSRTQRSSPTLPIVTPNIREWIDLTQQAMSKKFSEDLQAAIEIAFKGVTGSEIKQGVTTPRLLIASAMAGESSTNTGGFAALFFKAIGAKRLIEMKLTLSQMLEMYGEGELSELESEIVSSEVIKILSLADSESSSNNPNLGLEDVLKAIRQLRPRDCEIFAKGRGLDRFWSDFEGWVFTAMSSSPSDPQTRQNPIKLQEGRNSTGMDRKAALESVESQWKIFESKYKFASGFGLAATRARDVQKWLIQEAKAHGPSKTHIPLTSIPFQISEEVIISGLLLTAAEVKKGNRALAPTQAIDWAKRVVESANLDSSQLKAQIQRALFRAQTTETNSTHFDLIPDTLGNLFIQAEQLSKQISDGVIDERHFVAAWFRSLIRSSDSGSSMSEFPDLGILFECLSTHIGKDESVLQKDNRDGWRDLLSEIRDGLSAKPSRPEDPPVAPAESAGPAFLQLDDATKSQISEFWNTSGIRPGNALSESLAAACIKNQSFPSQLTPGQLIVGLLDRGKFLSQNSRETDRTLEIILYRRLSALGGSLNDLWSNVLENTERTEAKPTVSEELLEVFQIANQLEAKCSPGSVYVAPRHFIAAILQVLSDQSSFKSLKIDPLSSDDLKEALTTHLPVFENHDSASAWAEHFEGRHTDGDEDATDETEDHAATEERTFTAGSNADSEESPEPVPTGGQHNTSRHPHADELCLDIDRYAEASAQLLKNASDESDFVFGLFGPWGRGKTTLAEEIQFRVQKKGYVCVRFCAWKYPTRPEIWVHLYEEILRRAQMRLESGKERADLELPDEESWLQRLKISFRVGILSQGWSPLVLGSVLLLVSRLHWLDLSLGIGRAIGWSGAILLAAFALRSTHWIKALRFHYGVLPTHRDKLGLQSVVGHDLTNLLKVWISPASVSAPKPLRRFWLLWVSAGSVCFASILAAVGVLNHVASASQFGKRTGAPRFPVTEEASSFGDLVADKLPGFMGWPFRTIDNAHFEPLSTGLWIAGILVIIGLISVLIAALIRFKPQTFERLLLVVDDLDRCEPDQMLAVVESLRVFLDKSEMSRRLQILMLIDDRKLDQAILKRAREQSWIPKTRQEREAYCREQREKYFVTSIRLAQLDDDDISDITSKILDREANEDQAKRLTELKARKEANKRSLAKDDNAVSTTHVEKPARTIQHSVGPNLPKTEVTEIESEVRRPATSQEMDQERDLIRAEKDRAQIEEDERKKIEDELGRRTTNRLPKDINEKTKFTPIERRLLHEWVHEQSDEHTSPRTIRTLITRYLLARLMISTFGFEPDARTLLSALTGRPLDAKLQPDELRAYQRVAATLQQSS